MRRNHNSVLGVILVVVIGLCLLPSSAFSTTTVLNTFISASGNKFSGNFGAVILDVTPGEADFIIYGYEPKGMFSFSTSLTLYPENFEGVGVILANGMPDPPSGTPISGEIVVAAWIPYAFNGFEIINPNIVSEDQFGYYYENWVHNVKVPLPPTFGIATNEIPEPSTLLLIGSGLIGLAGYGRKKFFKK